jgi:hypothetical protein
MTANALKRSLPAIVVGVVSWMLVGTGQAFAAMPWWHLSTISAPAREAGREGELVVEATDLGDALAEGRSSPITVTDTLPAGVEPTAVYGGGGGGEDGSREQRRETNAALGHSNCSTAGQTVTCTYLWPLMSYERLVVAIDVKVTPGAGDGVNEAVVSGGGAGAAVLKRKLALETASAAYGVQGYEVAPEEEGGAVDTRAGSHPFQLTTTLTLNAEAPTFPILEPEPGVLHEEPLPVPQAAALTKDLSFRLPPGLIGNAAALPRCNEYTFIEQARNLGGIECPVDSVVGVATSIVNWLPGAGPRVPGVVTEPLYNLEPAEGEPARFGFATPAPDPVILDTAVRTGEDYGVTVTTHDVTEGVSFMGSQVTFWGTPSDPRHDTQRGPGCLGNKAGQRYVANGLEPSCPYEGHAQPFLIMPTSCMGPPVTSVEADSWSHPGVFVAPFRYTFENALEEPFSLDGCNELNFEPSIEVEPDGEQASSPSGLKVDVHVPQDAGLNQTGRAESAVKSITVTLPEGVALNPGGADGLAACSDTSEPASGTEPARPGGEIELGSARRVKCPDASKVATVRVHSPLLPDPLEGAVYLATPAPFGETGQNPFNSLIALYLVAEDHVSGVLVKLAGEVSLDAHTGRLTTTFNSPQLPFEDAELQFFGGSRAPLASPALCGSYTTTASLSPWSGNPPSQVSSPAFQITSGPNGAPCPNPAGDMSSSSLPFAPSLTAGTTSIQAGGFTPFTMTMSRPDGNQDLQGVRLKMPPGLLGMVSKVKLCEEPQADLGTCGSESLIGHTIVSVGLGPNPYSVTGGQVFLTGPYRGAPYGLSIVNPANAGPFHLGNVIVRARIEVDPITSALTVTTDGDGPGEYPIPHILDGIPLAIQHVNVSIDRPGFTFNPTDCDASQVTGSLSSDQGASSALQVPFQVTNCAVLGFKPMFMVSTSGKTSRRNGASLDVKLSYPAGSMGKDANVAKVKVDLPKQLPSRLTTLQKACPDSTFNQNPAACGAASRVGSATASTPILASTLSGPAYFVSHGGAKFPELIVVLQGNGVTVDLHGETFISKAGITSSTFRQVPDVPIGVFELKLPEGSDSALAANGNLCANILKMPTAFTAQNGLTIHQSTPISVNGCAKKKKKAGGHGTKKK